MFPQIITGAREHLLEMLLASATDTAILALDLAGCVTLWNEGARRIMGWTEAEMLGRPVHAIFTEADRQSGIPEAEMQSAAQTGRGTDERWHLRRDGSCFWASGEMMPLRDEAGAHVGFLKILRDRTTQVLEAEKQRADAAFLQGVLASSADCIKVLDLDAKLVFMSEGGQRVMEVSDFNAIRGCPWPDFWQGDGLLQARAAIETAKAGGVGRFQGAADTMAGHARDWDVQVTPILGADGRPEKLLSVSRDVTPIKTAERDLQEARGLNAAVLQSSHDCIVILDLEGNTRFVSPGGIEAMEVSDLDAIIGLSWLRVWQGADSAAARSAVAMARQGGVGRFRGFCPTHKGTPKWWDVAVSPLTGPDGAPDGLVSIARDVTKQHRAEAALRETEERRRLAVEAADIGTWSFDVDTLTPYWDDRCRILAGLAADLPVTYDAYLASIHPGDRARVQAVTLAALDPAGSGAYRAEYRVVGLADGVERWVAAAGRACFEGGRAISLAGTAMDVTVRRKAEDQARLLGEELQHRVKNTLAMVQAVVRQTLRTASTPAEAQAAIDPRLTALGRAHEMLTGGGWEGSDLRPAAVAALQPYDDGSGRFRLSGPPAWLSAQAAMSLALMLNELSTNAAKYGALSTPEGHVDLSWTVEPGADGASSKLHLVWREHGGPPVKEPARRGFGSRLIERGLASAIGGNATLTFAPGGVTCRVEGSLAVHRPSARQSRDGEAA